MKLLGVSMLLKLKAMPVLGMLLYIVASLGYSKVAYGQGGGMNQMPSMSAYDNLNRYSTLNILTDRSDRQGEKIAGLEEKMKAILDLLRAGNITPAKAEELKKLAAELEKRSSFIESMKSALKLGVTKGVEDAVIQTAHTILTSPLRNLQTNVNGFFGLLGLYLYKLAFGSLGLSWNTLAKLNNRIYALCSPFTGALAEAKDRKRRGELTGIDADSSLVLTESSWVIVRDELLKEIEHAIGFLKRYSSSYNQSYQEASYLSFKFHIGRLMHAFAPHDNEEVCFYIDRAVRYLEQLIEIIKTVNSFEEVEQKSNYIKRWLGWACASMEQIALILEGEKARPANGITFSKPSSQGGTQSSTQNVLDALLAGSPGA
jgi:hypothetical protein